MLRWVRWAVFGCSVVWACGGSSVRRGAGDDDGSSDDGSSGGLSGVSGSTAGTGASQGGATTTGGRGGTAGTTDGRGGTTGARGGSVGQGGTATGGEGGFAGEPGTGGDAGAGGAPVCDLAGGVTCSFEASCAVLGCGEAWSTYNAARCAREDNCAATGLCGSGERCVAAPVAGRFESPCRNEADSCDVGASGCECLYYEECFPSARCLPLDEFPSENDCPIAGLDCDGLEQAAATLRAYLGGDGFLQPYDAPGSIASSVQTCLDAVGLRAIEQCED